jgi:hypothetical protein
MADMSSANKKVSFLVLSNVESRPHAVTRYAADITPTHKNTQKRIRSQLVNFSCSVTARVFKIGDAGVSVFEVL